MSLFCGKLAWQAAAEELDPSRSSRYFQRGSIIIASPAGWVYVDSDETYWTRHALVVAYCAKRRPTFTSVFVRLDPFFSAVNGGAGGGRQACGASRGKFSL